MTHTISLRPGIQETIPLDPTDQDGEPIDVLADVLASDNAGIATVAVTTKRASPQSSWRHGFGFGAMRS